MTTKKHMNLQLFAEPTPPDGGEPNEPEVIEPTAEPTPEKTFTQPELDTLIKDRLARATKNQPTKDELKAFKAYQDTQKTEAEKAVANQLILDGLTSVANNKLIRAEIKNLDGYDTKLLSRLIDRSTITVDDSGEVSGITEQLASLELEFPMIKKQSASIGGANPPSGNATTKAQTEMDELRKAMGLPPK